MLKNQKERLGEMERLQISTLSEHITNIHPLLFFANFLNIYQEEEPRILEL